MENSAPPSLPEVHASLQDGDTRSWGSFTCVGRSHGRIQANFLPSGATATVGVVVQADLEQYALIALQQKLSVLGTFDGPLSTTPSKHVLTVTELAIYS